MEGMTAISLASGSNGNCIYVETCGLKLLFDAGISGRMAQKRLAQFGRDICEVDALFITHNHRDHVCSAGIFQRKFGIPLYITPRTLDTAKRRHSLGRIETIHFIQSGGTVELGDVTIETIPTPHDADDSVGFVVDNHHRRLGILTDLGHIFEELTETVASLDAVFIESNYDPIMLRDGSYPESLKQRVRGPQGHISNEESCQLLYDYAGGNMQWACLAHLSGDNNTPELALQTHRHELGCRMPIHLATRYGPGDEIHID